MTPLNDNEQRGELKSMFIELIQLQLRIGEQLNALSSITSAIAKKITENDLWK